jgi:hypothetical protein
MNPNAKPSVTVPCKPHLQRTGRRIPAARLVGGEPMCKRCFNGHAIDADVEVGGHYFGKLVGYGYGQYKPPKKRHFVSDRRVSQQESAH